MEKKPFTHLLAAMLLSVMFAHLTGDALLAILPGVLACMLMTVAALYWGVLMGFLFAKTYNRGIQFSYTAVHSLVFVLSVIAGFWEKFGKTVEADTSKVSSQTVAVLAIAIVIGALNEYGPRIKTFLRRSQKSKTAP